MPVSKNRKKTPADNVQPGKKNKFFKMLAISVGSAFVLAAILMAIRPQAGDVEVTRLVNGSSLTDMTLGNPDAPIEIIKYTSLTCIFCARFHNQTAPLIKSELVDTGIARYTVRDMGGDNVALAGAMLARCDENRYFDVTDVLYSRFEEWTRADNIAEVLRAYARQFGWSNEQFEACLDDREIYDGIMQMRAQALNIGVTATPTIFINGERLEGAQPFPVIMEVVNRKLAED